MYARRQNHSSAAPRGRHSPRAPRPPARARFGLTLRRGMDFGPLGDVEPIIQSEGLALAPMSTGDASLTVGGVSILPTAEAADLDGAKLQGLVVPGGSDDAQGGSALEDLLSRARASGLPVLAFGEGVGRAVQAFGGKPGDYREAPAVLVQGEEVTPLADRDQVRAAAASIG